MDEIGPPKSPESPPVPEAADRLLAKYVAVWFWSIFFGLNGGLSYNYLSFFSELIGRARFGPGPRAGDLLTAVMPIAYGLGAVANIGAWLFLYLFFSVYLLPVIFLGVTAVSEERRRRAGAKFLNRAYLLLLLAGLARLAPEVVGSVLPALFGL
jgi:hypothetical protein